MTDRHDPSAYAVGDFIYMQMPDGWNTYTASRYTVDKITPSGQIVAKSATGSTVRINAKGSIVGDSGYGRRVCSEVKARQLLAGKRLRAAWSLIRDAGAEIEMAGRRQDEEALAAAMSKLAQAMEARRAETGTGSVHDSAVPQGCAR